MDKNSFAGTDIYLPNKYKEYFHQYCLTRVEGSKNDPEESPFPRMVDMWFLALCLAIKENMKPTFKIDKNKYKAIEGVVFGSDPWRSDALKLIALSYSNDTAIINDPNEMMRIANGYAISGLPRLISLLEERGADVALDYLSEELEEIISG